MRKMIAVFILCMAIVDLSFAQNVVKLPKPSHKGKLSLEEVLFKRRSVRTYKDEALTLEELSQLLFACAGKNIDGVSGPTRAAPSAGGIYPVEVYVFAADIEGLIPGIYKYGYQDHLLTLVKQGDFRKVLSGACWDQAMAREAPLTFAFVGLSQMVSRRYGLRGTRLYLPLDVGVACENLYLQAESLGLGTVMLGAFSDNEIKKIIGLKRDLDTIRPFCIMPVGRK